MSCIRRLPTRITSGATTREPTSNWWTSWPGLRGYSYAFDVAAADGDSPYFCVFEADFDDAAAMAAAQGSPQGQATRADVANYATGGVIVVNYELRAG